MLNVLVAEDDTPAPSPVGSETLVQAAIVVSAARPAAVSNVRLSILRESVIRLVIGL
ncbi:hypothetical protein MPLSOD_40144 [Mesorhizobium sp. SOD10]|nr:hypothetical protein MPLSOD_40144 [Mesorhizobium sp. SOD10]